MFLESPSGGFKVVYEYANRLQRRGHKVTLVHPRNISPSTGLIDLVKQHLWAPRLRWRHRGEPIPWFPLDRSVKVELVADLRERFIPDGEVIIATAFQTAAAVASCGRRKGQRFHLIQSFESWMGAEEAVRESWRLPLRKIVVSGWLEQIAREIGVEDQTTRIPIGLDFTHFRVTQPIEDRWPARIGMLAHPLPIKGTSDGFTALEIVRRQHPEIEAVVFGTEQPGWRLESGSSWPDWISYQQQPAPAELVALYNSCQIFLHPSRLEGWGLPGAEAMACGCALVAARNQGIEEFAVDEVNALLAPVESPSILAEKVLRLLGDGPLRRRLAREGARHIQRFDWERSVTQFEELVSSPTISP